jgi:prepilin-type N-terminal cleavage/methylation domain-containing protein
MNLGGKTRIPGNPAGFSKSIRLHKELKKIPPARFAGGFSLIEVLVVVLVIGIICASGVSIYAGATTDTQKLTIIDNIQSFFAACKQRVQLRNSSVTLRYRAGILFIDQSASLRLRIPELSAQTAKNIDGLVIETDGFRLASGERQKNLNVEIVLPGNRIKSFKLEY